MATEFELRRTNDVFTDNDVIGLDWKTWSGPNLGAVAWLTRSSSPREAHLAAFAQVAHSILSDRPEYALVLLTCHSDWLTDSRLVRRRRLWGSLRARGLSLPAGGEIAEAAVEGKEGVRYFGARYVTAEDIESAVAVLHAESASHLAAVKRSDMGALNGLVASGWDRSSFGPSSAVVDSVARGAGIVLWPVGAFDDREAGVVAIARPEVLDRALRGTHGR